MQAVDRRERPGACQYGGVAEGSGDRYGRLHTAAQASESRERMSQSRTVDHHHQRRDAQERGRVG
jgi:hypothetical protein